jgi:hypothetical protein
LEGWKPEDLRHRIQNEKATKTASNQKVASDLVPLFRFHVHEVQDFKLGRLFPETLNSICNLIHPIYLVLIYLYWLRNKNGC